MKAFVGITDAEWFRLLSDQTGLQEVNFWQPGGNRQFGALEVGELFLFKLHSPHDFIVGGGLFAHSSLLPVSLAWDTFGIGNGVTSLPEMRRRIERYRRRHAEPQEDYTIGCIVLTQPFFLPEASWIPVPPDWKANIVQGRTYDLSRDLGRSLYDSLLRALRSQAVAPSAARSESFLSENLERYGPPLLVTPRLGQGAFRLLVTDAYSRRCSVTGERVLPVLEAAHIRPFSSGGEHRVDNGLLIRSDLHMLFDRGYVTVAEDLSLEVSRRIREEFENGRDYYALQGRKLRPPLKAGQQPALDNLRWHNENVFRG